MSTSLSTTDEPQERIDPKGPTAWIRHLIFGFIMGSADVVPGVSGGTVAFVVGIYARLVDAIRDASRLIPVLAKGRVKEFAAGLRSLDFGLIVPLLTGIALAVLTLAALIEGALETYPIEMSSLFLGLVAGSVIVAWGLMHKPSAQSVVIAAVSAIAFFYLLGLAPEVDPHEADITLGVPLWAYFGAGAIAICAMILPGISGSFLLVVMGMYANVLGAVTDRDFLTVAVFLLGCITGLALFSRLLAYLLDKYHDFLVAGLIGLMIGSLRVLWPWPNGTASTQLAAPTGSLVAPILLFVAGFVVVLILGRIGALKEEKQPHPG